MNEFIETVELGVKLLGYVSLGITIIIAVVIKVKTAKKNNLNEEEKAKLEKWVKRAEQLNQIQKEIMSYIPLAEQFVNFESKDKKEWVLTKANQFCLNNGIPYDDDKATEILEHAIDLTKSVNKRGTQAKTR